MTILQRVKEAVTGFSCEDDSFDLDIITAINTIFLSLYQQNIGDVIFTINKDTTWDDFIKRMYDKKRIESFIGVDINTIKRNSLQEICYVVYTPYIALLEQYIILKTKMLFDPPANTAVSKAYENSISELEYRMNIEFNDYKRR